MYLFLSIISLVVSACLAIPGTAKEVKGLNGSCPEVQFAVQAINLHYQKQEDNTTRTFRNVLKAYRQITVGEKWYLNLIVDTPQKTEICQVDVWSRPWMNGSEALKTTMEPICIEGTGQQVVVDINSTEVQNALNFVLSRLNDASDCPHLWKPESIGQVTCEIDFGDYFNFTDVVMSPTNCSKENTNSLIGCVATQNVTYPPCHFGVWHGWNNSHYRLIQNDCEIKSLRRLAGMEETPYDCVSLSLVALQEPISEEYMELLPYLP